jgi:hypothetical protein
MDTTSVSRLADLQGLNGAKNAGRPCLIILVRQNYARRMALLIYSSGDRLGIVVESAKIRLMPDIGDKYIWAAMPEKKHLFTKQLNKYSIGAYMELCRGVGVSFEAVTQLKSDTGIMIEETAKVKQSCFKPNSAFNILINFQISRNQMSISFKINDL